MTVHLRREQYCHRCHKRPIWLADVKLCACCYHLLKAAGGYDKWRREQAEKDFIPFDMWNFEQDFWEWCDKAA